MDRKRVRKWMRENLLFRVVPDTESWNVATLADEVKRLEALGYVVKKEEDGVFELVKWRFPPISFLIYLKDVALWPVLALNVVLGYRFTARVYMKDGEIVTE